MQLRIICNDPYATDSSLSDEEIGYKPRHKKQFVREIIIPNPPTHNPIASRNHVHDKLASMQTESGKSGAFISDPVKQIKINGVSSDDEHIEATTAYDSNKFKFDSIDQFPNPVTESMALKLNSNVSESEITVNEESHDFSLTASENHAEFTKQQFECVAVDRSEKNYAFVSYSTVQESIKDKSSSLQEDGVSLAKKKGKAANAYRTWILAFRRLVKRCTKNRIGKDRSSIPETSASPGSDPKSLTKENFSLQNNDFQIANQDIKARRQLVIGLEGVVRKRSREEFLDPSDSDSSEGLEEIKSGIGSAEIRGHTNKGTKPIENDESKPPRLNAQESAEAATRTTTRYVVRQNREGKWVAEIGKPRKRTELYLGTFNSQEEAVDNSNEAPTKEKAQELGFQSNVSSTTKKAKLEPGLWFSDKGALIEQSNSKPPGVGEGESVEAAVTTSDMDYKKFRGRKLPPGTRQRTPGVDEGESVEAAVTTTDMNCEKFRGGKRPPGVRQTRPGGSWSAEIRMPRSNKRVYLGPYKTMEEAEHVYNRKKREFQSIASSSSSKKQKLQSTAASSTWKPQPAVRSSLDQCGSYSASHPASASPAFEESTVKTDLQSTAATNITKEPEQHVGYSLDQYGSSSISLLASTSPEVEKPIATFGSSHSSDGSSNCSTVEDLSFMKTEQVDEFGCGIINCYCQLLGEYSKLDDELWLCKPGEEEEDEAAASTIE